MLDDRTRRAGERAAEARRRAFDQQEGSPSSARPLGVVPIVLLCILGAVVDGYAVLALSVGTAFDVVSLSLAAAAVVAAYALGTGREWAWIATWLSLALHLFLHLVSAPVVGTAYLALATAYGLALTYATGRRAVEVSDRGSGPTGSAH